MSPDLREQLQSSLGSAFAIEHELGGGGMSRVFVAHDAQLDRKVVVKVLSPELAASVNGERFKREIRVVASLQQANIVPLLSAGETDGLPFYTMPFVEGPLAPRTSEPGGAAAGHGGGEHPARCRSRADLCARARRRPPGHQARERAPVGRSGRRHRLRHRQGAGGLARAGAGNARAARRRHADRDGHDVRHADLHGAGAGRGRSRTRTTVPTSIRSAAWRSSCSRAGRRSTVVLCTRSWRRISASAHRR